VAGADIAADAARARARLSMLNRVAVRRSVNWMAAMAGLPAGVEW
jgi:hypothetical protein